jgi:hypothetical protein
MDAVCGCGASRLPQSTAWLVRNPGALLDVPTDTSIRRGTMPRRRSLAASRFIFTPLFALATGVGLGACTQDTPPVSEYAAPAVPPRDVGPGAGDFELAHAFPGYAGRYFDEAGDLVVLVTNQATREPIRRVMTQFAAANAARGISSAVATVRFRTVAYDFWQLTRWRSDASQLAAEIPEIVSIGIHTVENCVEVGVSDQSKQAVVRRAMAKRGVPADALLVVHVEWIGP